MQRLIPPLPVALHNYQLRAVDSAVDWIKGNSGSHYLIASPTGTGKSYMELALHRMLDRPCWFITPRVEIIIDMVRKLGYEGKKPIEYGESLQMTTPIKLRNRLLSGDMDVSDIAALIKDEAHHDSADTYGQIDAMMPEEVKHIGFTATPFRGTPRGTAEYLAKWGDPHWAITYPEAVRQGFLSMPVCHTWPLVNDDLLEITSTGEFVISRLEAAVTSQVEHALEKTIAAGWWHMRAGKQVYRWSNHSMPNRPTIIGVPSSGVMPEVERCAEKLKLSIRYVTQETGQKERQELFAGVRDSRWALCHINVVSEGVDLPIRQYLDLASVMSPVAFLQRFGRATRPVKDINSQPTYVCCNRNLERHGYLLDGCLPPSVVQFAQQAFGGPSDRGHMRVFGIQSLGKLQGFHVKLTSGITVTAYNVTTMEGHTKREYCTILHPLYVQPLWFTKESPRVGDTYSWGRWKRTTAPAKLEGFKSASPRPLTEKQQKFWDNNAARHGLDPTQKVDAKRGQLVFVLKDVGAKLS